MLMHLEDQKFSQHYKELLDQYLAGIQVSYTRHLKFHYCILVSLDCKVIITPFSLSYLSFFSGLDFFHFLDVSTVYLHDFLFIFT